MRSEKAEFASGISSSVSMDSVVVHQSPSTGFVVPVRVSIRCFFDQNDPYEVHVSRFKSGQCLRRSEIDRVVYFSELRDAKMRLACHRV